MFTGERVAGDMHSILGGAGSLVTGMMAASAVSSANSRARQVQQESVDLVRLCGSQRAEILKLQAQVQQLVSENRKLKLAAF